MCINSKNNNKNKTKNKIRNKRKHVHLCTFKRKHQIEEKTKFKLINDIIVMKIMKKIFRQQWVCKNISHYNNIYVNIQNYLM